MHHAKAYAALSFWGNVLQEQCCASGDGYVVSILRDYDLTTTDGVRDLAARAIAELCNNRVPNVESARLLWQISQMLKKFRYGCTATPEGMQMKWLERNAAVKQDVDVHIAWILDGMRKLLAPLDAAYELEEADGRFGNGAVFEHYSAIARWNQCERFSYNVCDPANTREWSSSSHDTARLCCVPKDMFKLRSITVEPAEATFLQQHIRSRLIAAAAKVMPRSSAIPQQLGGAGPEIQRRRALEGSRDGSLATIDLSDASDSISWAFVSRVFPPLIMSDLERCRSQYCETVGGKTEVLMYAGMGNATTFIVESLYFWAACTVISRYLRDFTPVSVFGDDIVLGTKAATHPLFNHYMSRLGLTVNMAKSGLSLGPGFREACGLVAYYGEELPLLRVQGYQTEKPEELVSLCSLINCAMAPDSRYAPFLRTSVIVVGKQVVDDFHPPILPEPPIREGVYLVDPSEQIGGWSYRSRWDAELQHPVVRVRCLTRQSMRRRLKHLTLGEAQGVLRGQLRTEFADARVGYKSRFCVLTAPGDKSELESAWVPLWSSDASFLSLLG